MFISIPLPYLLWRAFFLFLPLQATETLMKCRMMRHFIWVFIVCKRRQLVELPTILLRLTGYSRHFSQMRLLCTSHLYPDSGPENIGTFSFSKQNKLHPFRFIFTGAQLRHNDFQIFTDPSRIYTYNCDETFKTTSRTSSENMPGHA